jgi:hypothetical protein
MTPGELAPSREITDLRHVEIRPSQPNDYGKAAILDPLLHHTSPSWMNAEILELHRQVWSTPTADLPAAWQEELGRLGLSEDLSWQDSEAEAA